MSTQITLLKDAEGREIPLNTTALYDKDGSRREVDWFKFYPDKDRWDIVFKDSYAHFSPHSLSLTPPDSWEKLEEDLDRCIEADCVSLDVSLVLEDIKQRIRKLRGED